MSTTERALREALANLLISAATEANEKGAGGYHLARMADARQVLAEPPSVPLPAQPEPDALREALTEIFEKGGNEGIEDGEPVEFDGVWCAATAAAALSQQAAIFSPESTK